jgi:hypothetical protein
MSIKKIIKEAMDRDPIALKETLKEELRSRVSLALEAKMKEMDDMDDEDMDDEDEDEDDEDEDLDESADTQLAEISKKKVGEYSDKSRDEFKKQQASGSPMTDKQKRRYSTGSDAGENAYAKVTGRARVNATEDMSDDDMDDNDKMKSMKTMKMNASKK